MDKNTKNTRKEQYLTNRKGLIAISQTLRLLVKEGAIDSVNEGLKDMYMEQHPDIEEFKTFGQWKQEGATVRKGEKAFIIWGQPRQGEQVPEGSNEPEEYKYWPICYLFANTQVITADQMKEHREKVNRPESAAIPARELATIDDYM